MNFLNRKKKEGTEKLVPAATVEAEHDSRVQVVVHKNATKEAVEEANKANDHLNNLLLNNGFTLKIYVAAKGGFRHQLKGK